MYSETGNRGGDDIEAKDGIMKDLGNNYRIGVLREGDIEKAVEVLVEGFVNNPTEPFFSTLGVKKEEMAGYRMMWLKKHISQGYCLKCVDKNGEIVGCCGVSIEDVGNVHAIDPQDWTKENSPKIRILNEPHFEKYFKENDVKKYLYLNFIAVSKAHRGNALGTSLSNYAMEKARKEMNVRYATSLCTNVFSSQFTGKLKGAVHIAAVPIEDYELDGRRIFEGCNQRTIDYLKQVGKYKESYNDNFTKEVNLFVMDLF